ncbi:hypothetical protein ACFCV8_08100 [Streptomyces sp. NPDC056347]|uniref:hypothetical protein n=1 Tax=Streptomyces sp. NPDC056347 TaxID=3345790 RepID=UPI0035D7F825
MQPCVLDTRGRVLHDVAYLQGLLTGARTHDFPEDLVERLAVAVDRGHDLAELLATTARATTARGTDCG